MRDRKPTSSKLFHDLEYLKANSSTTRYTYSSTPHYMVYLTLLISQMGSQPLPLDIVSEIIGFLYPLPYPNESDKDNTRTVIALGAVSRGCR